MSKNVISYFKVEKFIQKATNYQIAISISSTFSTLSMRIFKKNKPEKVKQYRKTKPTASFIILLFLLYLFLNLLELVLFKDFSNAFIRYFYCEKVIFNVIKLKSIKIKLDIVFLIARTFYIDTRAFKFENFITFDINYSTT